MTTKQTEKLPGFSWWAVILLAIVSTIFGGCTGFAVQAPRSTIVRTQQL